MANETVGIFRNSPEAASISIKTDIGGDMYVEGDSRQMGQVFWNLILNAAHAMEGGGTITVR
ncbi:MAG: HAMP domain-containing histidine kinase, partial [Deltaproteobacteria bacterium]|nr:HAMP domain-containing histidine kinase [Deltaproteobacteria bacterium]